MKTAVTISLLPEHRSGPFVLWVPLPLSCAIARKLGFDAVEIFPPSADSLKVQELKDLLTKHQLGLAAIGTGAGWVKHKLRLTDPDPDIRRRAREFAAGIVELAGQLGAPAIIGSMQGRFETEADRPRGLEWLGEALEELGGKAAKFNQVLLFEPLNRYESNVFSRQGDAADFIRKLRSKNIRLLCDLFHMNIEERGIAETLRDVGPLVGHVHWADSNRQPMGCGHTVVAPIIGALRSIGYTGYLSAEVMSSGNGLIEAQQSLDSMRHSISSP